MTFIKGHKINVGRKHTKETIDKIKKSSIGKHNHKHYGNRNYLKRWQEEHGNWLKGKTYEEAYGKEKAMQLKIIRRINLQKPKSKEWREKLSLLRLGDKNPNWNNGSSAIFYPLEFNNRLKQRIRKKFNFTCQLCLKHQNQFKRKLAIHHINYDKNDCREENFTLLCVSCNLKVNKNRKYWKEFFIRKFKYQ